MSEITPYASEPFIDLTSTSPIARVNNAILDKVAQVTNSACDYKNSNISPDLPRGYQRILNKIQEERGDREISDSFVDEVASIKKKTASKSTIF